MTTSLCPWDSAEYLIFSENVPTLLFYSHFTALLSILVIGGFILALSKSSLSTRILNIIFLLFGMWIIFDLIAWATNDPAKVMYSWSSIVLIEPIIFVASFYLFNSFWREKIAPFSVNLLFFIILLPLIFFAPTSLNLSAVNLYDCVADEGFLALYYSYGVEIFSFLVILTMLIKALITQTGELRKKTAFFGVGLLFFLLTFSLGNLWGSIGGTSYDWELAQYGLFGMTFFMCVLAYLIVKFKAFEIKLLATQALVVGLVILVGSQLFFVESTTNFILVTITLILSCAGGYFLVRSVKKEVRQREEIERLAVTLEKANERLKELDKMKSEFVSIASHQLRGPLAVLRGYASMLMEGTYGKLPPKAVDVVDRIADTSNFMALSVEDYLNVSRIEAGNMKYEMSDFNLKDVAEKLVDEMRSVAIKKGLTLIFRSDCDGSCVVHADVGKTRQIIMNLVDNAIKYTPKGSVTVVAHDDIKKKMVTISVQDSGVGIKQEEIDGLFEKFVRAKNSNKINATGTGLGLFVAKKMITEMKGRIWVESDGEGTGSTFHIEFPLIS